MMQLAPVRLVPAQLELMMIVLQLVLVLLVPWCQCC